jgi:site-specific DNA recombinase
VDNAMKAAGYIRLSIEDDVATGPVVQRRDLQRLADTNGWEVDWYEDLDRSAYSGVTRPAYDRMLDRLDDYDVLACWKLDRLIRRTRDLPAIQDLCEQHQVQLVSATEGTLGGGPGGQFILGIFAGLAELESATISMRVRSSQQHLRDTGRWRGGIRPYGYRPADNPDGPGRILVVNPDEQAIVAEVVARTIAGEPARQIAWDLTARGVTTSRGKPWTSQTLSKMLQSPTLIGQHTVAGDVARDDDGLPVQMWEPLIDPATWRRLQAEMASRQVGPRRRADSTLLGGLVVCGRCGSTMGGWAADHPQASYTCTVRHQRGPGQCLGNSINRRKLDELVTAVVVETVTPDRIAQARARLAVQARPDPSAARIAQIEDALARLEHDRQVLGLYDGDETRYVERWKAYTDELAKLRQGTPPVTMSVAGLDPNLDLAALPRTQLRQVMLAAIVAVEIGPSSGRKRWDPSRVTRIRWTWE